MLCFQTENALNGALKKSHESSFVTFKQISFFFFLFGLFCSRPIQNGRDAILPFLRLFTTHFFLCSFEIYFRLFLWYCCFRFSVGSSTNTSTIYIHHNKRQVLISFEHTFCHSLSRCTYSTFHIGVILCTLKRKLLAEPCKTTKKKKSVWKKYACFRYLRFIYLCFSFLSLILFPYLHIF